MPPPVEKDEVLEAVKRADAARNLPPPKYPHGEFVFIRARVQLRACDERVAEVGKGGALVPIPNPLQQHNGEWVVETAGPSGNTNDRSRLIRVLEENMVSVREAREIIGGRR